MDATVAAIAENDGAVGGGTWALPEGLRPISELPKFRLTAVANQFTDSHCPVPQRGVAHVTDVGRDAVDAAARVTNAACWRTAKSCGSDAPMLASSLR